LSVSEVRKHSILSSAAITRGYVILGREAYSLGRGRECVIPLASSSVSRKHCEVAWGRLGQCYSVADLGSMNGTLVNGQKIAEPTALNPGDSIIVGNVVIRFLVIEATRDEVARRLDPRNDETTRVQHGTDSLLTGKLTRSVLHEVCQLIETNHHSGELHVQQSGEVGMIRFSEGIIVDARCGEVTGEAAARRVLAFRTGNYAFGVASPTEGPLRIRPLALSLELARELDEVTQTRAMPRAEIEDDPDEDTTESLPRLG
jgi:pSer/pThr/pTyr-binding forkhead associated (FHA) protein